MFEFYNFCDVSAVATERYNLEATPSSGWRADSQTGLWKR